MLPPSPTPRSGQGAPERPLLPPILVQDVHPRTPASFPAKGVVGVPVSAIVVEGHDRLGVRVRWRPAGGGP